LIEHLKYAIPAGLAVGLAAAAVDAIALEGRHPAWFAFAFLVYGCCCAAALTAVALAFGAVCGALRRRPGGRTLAAFYLGLPLFVLIALAGGELFRRAVIPSVFSARSEVAPILAASICGFAAGAVFVWILVAAARSDARDEGPAGKGLRFLGTAGVGLAVLCAAALLVDGITYGQRKSPGRNLILICVDALRPDHLSCYGYGRETSPNIDRLCQAGARFERAICQSPGSTASHASIMTSLYPLTHGAWNVGDSLHEDVPSIQGHLRERGFATAFFGNNYFLGPRYGFASGYDTFGNEELVYRTERAPLGSFWRSLGAARLMRAWRVEPGAPSDFSIEQSLAWIKKNRNRKFFLFLHVMDPHAPYSPPGEYRRMFYSRDYEGEVRDNRELRKKIDTLQGWEKEQLVDRYDGEIAYADSKIGRLVDALRGWGLMDRTVLMITADHGEVLDEHGGIFNHGYLWDSCVRVPLIVNFPPAVPSGAVIKDVVQSIDICPTALSLMGEPPLAGAQGVDLTGLMNGDPPAREALAYTLGGITEGEGYSLTGPRWKLAWLDDEHVELYDLQNDPGETKNLVDQEPVLAAELKRRLLTWIEESAAAAEVPRSETANLQRLSEEVKERLRTLGYIE
jgi:arylsulfatase A-like enzyme